MSLIFIFELFNVIYMEKIMVWGKIQLKVITNHGKPHSRFTTEIKFDGIIGKIIVV